MAISPLSSNTVAAPSKPVNTARVNSPAPAPSPAPAATTTPPGRVDTHA